MDLQLSDKLFLITDASGGLGSGVTLSLLREGARIIAVGTNHERLDLLKSGYPEKVTPIAGNLFDLKTADDIIKTIGYERLDGVFLNASGPPAMPFTDSSLADWDNAYNNILKWKINLVQKLLPLFREQNYGRIIFSERYQ